MASRHTIRGRSPSCPWSCTARQCLPATCRRDVPRPHGPHAGTLQAAGGVLRPRVATGAIGCGPGRGNRWRRGCKKKQRRGGNQSVRERTLREYGNPSPALPGLGWSPTGSLVAFGFSALQIHRADVKNGGGGGIRTHVPGFYADNSISSRARYGLASLPLRAHRQAPRIAKVSIDIRHAASHTGLLACLASAHNSP